MIGMTPKKINWLFERSWENYTLSKISGTNVKKVFPTWKHVFQLGRVINKAIIPLYDALKHDWYNTKKSIVSLKGAGKITHY